MNTVHKQKSVFYIIIAACVCFVMGLLMLSRPAAVNHVKAESSITVRVGYDIRGEYDGYVSLELYSDVALKRGDRLLYNNEIAEVFDVPSEENETDYYDISCVAGGEFDSNQGKTITVILNPPVEAMHFVTGAQASLSSSTLYRMCFLLYVSESDFTAGGSNTLTISFSNGYGTNSKMGNHYGQVDKTTLTISKSDPEYNFGENPKAVYIYVSTTLYDEVQLTARIGSRQATSATRTLFELWQRAVEDNFGGESVDDSVKSYIRETVLFGQTNSAFSLSSSAVLSAESGLTVLLNVPEEQMNLLKSGRQITKFEEEKGSVHGSPQITIAKIETFCEYYLVLSRSSNPAAYGNGAYNGSGVTDYYYSFDSTNRHIKDTLELNGKFENDSKAKFDLPIPTDAQTVYTYYAKIVKHEFRVSSRYNDAWTPHELDSTNSVTAFTTNSIQTSVRSLAESLLARDATMTDSERAYLQDAAGIQPSTSEISVTLHYKELADYATLRDKSYTFSVKSVYAQSKTLVLSALYDLTDYKNIANLNVVYSGEFYENGYRYITEKRIYLQAKDFAYTYDSGTQKGMLDVVYHDFRYKDLALRVTNNDPTNRLTMNYYTANVEAGSQTTTLTYDFAEIKEQLYNSCLWLFDLTKDKVKISGTPSGVSAYATDSALIVTFPNESESELVTLSLQTVAEIVPDVEYTVTYEYTALGLKNGEIEERTIKSEPFTMLYSQIATYNYNNFMVDHGEEINAAVAPELLGGAVYFVPKSVQKDMSPYESENHTCRIVVTYDYNTLFKITNNVTSKTVYKSLNHTSLLYRGEELIEEIPSGYRVVSLTTDGLNRNNLTITLSENYREILVQVNVNTHSKQILPLRIDFSDNWHVKINYLDEYIDYGCISGEKDARPAFAEKKCVETNVRVSNYADIMHLTAEDLAAILSRKDMSILGISNVDTITVTFDGVATYTVDTTYSYAALKQLDYNGGKKEIKIPLTSYADWCETYGKDWSILFLNTVGRHYFQYSNDIERENLYGFFSVAVFKEQVSDLNYYFKNNTGDGRMTIFSDMAVRGSGLYRFFDRLKNKSGFIGPLLGVPLITTMCMNLCELVDDDNAMYYSYFFFLDGTSKDPYISNGGAHNADDTNNAITNAVQNIKDWAQNLWNDISGSKEMKIFKIVCGAIFGIFVVVFVVGLLVKLLEILGLKKRK